MDIHKSIVPQEVVHNCPICGGTVYHRESYDTEVCIWCVHHACNEHGAPIRIFHSSYWFNGFEVQIEGEENKNDNHACFIHGTPCYIAKTESGVLAVLKQ